VAVGYQGTILSSLDGVTWSNAHFDAAGLLWSVTYGDSQFVAVGDSGSIVVSHNGSLWTKVNSGVNVNLNAITYGKGTFVAVGDKGAALVSKADIAYTPAFREGAKTASGKSTILYKNHTVFCTSPYFKHRSIKTEIIDANGRKLYSGALVPTSGVISIDLGRFPQGVVFVSMTDGAHRMERLKIATIK
jgi:hypothetical protein